LPFGVAVIAPLGAMTHDEIEQLLMRGGSGLVGRHYGTWTAIVVKPAPVPWHLLHPP
jgi:hypothetical protein